MMRQGPWSEKCVLKNQNQSTSPMQNGMVQQSDYLMKMMVLMMGLSLNPADEASKLVQ